MPDDVRITVAPDADWWTPDDRPTTPIERVRALPVGPGVAVCLHAYHKTAHAVVAVRPGSGEIRIPYIRRKRKGDFKGLLDALVDQLDTDTVRFTNIFETDDEHEHAYHLANEFREEFGLPLLDIPDDMVRIEDALVGFDTEYERWGDDDVATLVGTWYPDGPPD